LRYNWLLLDADGTLFDYDRAEVEALQKTFEQMGCDFQPGYVENYRHINGRMWLEFEQGLTTPDRIKLERFELLFQATGVVCDPAEFSRAYLENLATIRHLIPGAEQAIKSLHGQVGMVIITNGLQSVQRRRLHGSPIAAYVSDIVISEEVGAAKPDIQIFEAAFRSMGQPGKAEVLMVGDSLSSDIRGGNNYGIDTCWFNPSRRARNLPVEICYEITHLSELPGIVGG
jgi:2-haloacid dehalogenase